MPIRLCDSVIDGPEPDTNGDQRYFLKDTRSINNNERYLDYPDAEEEHKEFIVTWGRHNHYWKNQLSSILNTFVPSEVMKNTSLKTKISLLSATRAKNI